MPSLALAFSIACAGFSRAEDMPGLINAAQPGRLICHFDQRCALGSACEAQSLSGELAVGGGSLFSQEAKLRIGEETILLQPPLIETGEWLTAPFVIFSGVTPYAFPDTVSVSVLTRSADGETVYTVHNREAPRAVTWHGICNEASS